MKIQNFPQEKEWKIEIFSPILSFKPIIYAENAHLQTITIWTIRHIFIIFCSLTITFRQKQYLNKQ